MNNLINKALHELKSDATLNSNPLIKMLSETVSTSIKNNATEKEIYNQLKTGLINVNEHLKFKKIDAMISQFKQNEKTANSEIMKMSDLADLKGLLEGIKGSTAYSNPTIVYATDKLLEQLSSTPEFMLYPAFVRDFSKFNHEKSIDEAIKTVSTILSENASDLEVLYTINTMKNMDPRLYEGAINSLSEMLAKKEYTSDIIHLKLGQNNLPIITNLVNSLKIIESRDSSNLNMGAGNGDTVVSNLIAPAAKSKDGKSLIFYDNGVFMRVSESNKETKVDKHVHIISEGFKISTIDPEFVKDNYPELYQLSESYAKLGFAKNSLNEGVETSNIKNFKIGLQVNENDDVSLYLNDKVIKDVSSVNFTEALVMESAETRKNVEYVIENMNNIFNFEFIKTIKNSRRLAESVVFKLNDSYLVFENVNNKRQWNSLNEKELTELFANKFQYDISPIFQTKIDEITEAKRAIDARKKEINENIEKLEGSASKISATLESNSISTEDAAKLEDIKDSINESIASLKEEFINIDLHKKNNVK